jgi:hypothetical protein
MHAPVPAEPARHCENAAMVAKGFGARTPRDFRAPLKRWQTRHRDFSIGADGALPCRASFVFSSLNARLDTKLQKVLAKSKAHH